MNSRLSLLLLLPAVLAAKSYRYPEIVTEVRLMPDGDVRVIQDRTYEFNGSFSWAYVDLKKKGAAEISVAGVYEEDREGWKPARNTEVEDRGGSVYVRWEYSAEDEEKTFRLDYTLSGAVRRHEDVAEFYWKVVEDEHEPVEYVEATVSLPGPSPGLFKVYVHSRTGPGRLDFSPDMDAAFVTLEDLPRNAFVETRVLADPALFPQVTSTGRQAYAGILASEKRNYFLSGLRVFLLIPLAVLLLLVAPLVLLVVFYRRFGREPRVEYEAVYEHEPPRLAPPLCVPAIMQQRAGSGEKLARAFQGTFAQLLELCRRGIVEVEELGRGKDFRFEVKKPDELGRADRFGRAAAGLVFSAAGAGQAVTQSQFKSYAKSHAESVRRSLNEEYDGAVEWWEKELGGPLLDPRTGRAYRGFVGLTVLSAGLGVIGGVVGLGAVITPGSAPLHLILPGVFGFLSVMVFAGLGSTIFAWTPAAHLEHLRWKRFRKFLREFSAIEQAPVKLLAIWEHYYVYAAALGVAEEFLKNVGRLALERGQTLPAPVWFAASGASVTHAGLGSFQASVASLSNFGANFSGMVASFSPSSSSGGGFSGGGGGGGGGGSSGAG